MNIPKTLKIGNIPYTVSLVTDQLGSSHCGTSSLSKGEIKIDESLVKELQYETFFHEIIHQLLDQKSYHTETKDESLIDTLSGGLYQVLKENNMLK